MRGRTEGNNNKGPRLYSSCCALQGFYYNGLEYLL